MGSSGAAGGATEAGERKVRNSVVATQIGTFERPVYTTSAPGRAHRRDVFVAEKAGVVRMIRKGKKRRQPFLDIREMVAQGPEQGLLSIAFDPRYERNGRLYAYFTDLQGDIRVVRFERSRASRLRADPGSLRDVITIPHRDYPSHNGGQASFGPDGKMWIATGDGGGGCDPGENAQSRSSLLGKLLRISPRPRGGYRIPAGNPFRGRPGRGEIYAYGLRNPFRLSFDRRTGTIAIGDVGQSAFEEVNYETLKSARGANFGWDAFEGSQRLVRPDEPPSCRDDEDTPVPPRTEAPIFEYPHDAEGLKGCSVTGGLVVRDPRLSGLRGRYLFSDLCNTRLRSFVPKLGGAVKQQPLGPSVPSPTSITAGRKNRIYVTSIQGGVFRLDPARRRGSAEADTGSRSGSGTARVGDGRGGFRAARVASFDRPVHATGPEGARGLLFVVEQEGVIRLVKDGRKLPGAFLNIRDRVLYGGERGLLSVAFSPRYKRNRLFYVYFTDRRGDIVVQEFRRSKGNPRKAKKGSGRTVIRIRHRENSNHNGGQLQFGPDGKLYLGTGDGGGSGDPEGNAQNRNSLLGKLLRINPRRSGKRPYAVPRDNPFVGRPGRDEIYSLGLRNPFRFSFDRRSGRLVIGDVGQNAREEVDYETLRGARGANFGWNAFEGKIRFDRETPAPKRHARPIFDYPHTGGRCSITGGYVSRDRRIPSLLGRYLYADLCTGEIRSLVPKLGGARGDRGTGLASSPGVASFGEDSRGRIYIVNAFNGKVSVIRPQKRR